VSGGHRERYGDGRPTETVGAYYCVLGSIHGRRTGCFYLEIFIERYNTCRLALILETREVAEEGLKLIQQKLGTTVYLEQYNIVRQDMLGRRREREMKRSLEAVTDPERVAQKKIRQHEKVILSFPAVSNVLV
jgi:hypothetical protein